MEPLAMENFDHEHKRTSGMVTCVCAKCGRVYMRQGEAIELSSAARATRVSPITPERISIAVQQDMYKNIIPQTDLDKMVLLNNMCAGCINEVGLNIFF